MFFSEKYVKFFQGIFFFILRLGLKSALGRCSFHYYCYLLYEFLQSKYFQKSTLYIYSLDSF